MHSYAQTNVQLFNQLRSEGYSKEERERVLEAYELGMRLFTGLFLPSGKPFIDHLLGTASILASLQVSVEIVTAGLIHAAYLHGDFGGIRKGISESKRRQVRQAVGEKVEEYVARYDRLAWSAEKILTLDNNLDHLEPVDRDVLLMRLANELEHQLDLAALYFAHGEKQQKGHQQYLERYGPMIASMADGLGFAALAKEMATVFSLITLAQVPVEPCIRSNQYVAYLILPRSCRVRFSLIFCRKLFSGYLLRVRVLNKVKSLWRRFAHSLLRMISQPTCKE
ncbi:MAG TPA: HD domain-containing protein [Candidatus Binatia bacterium]